MAKFYTPNDKTRAPGPEPFHPECRVTDWSPGNLITLEPGALAQLIP